MSRLTWCAAVLLTAVALCVCLGGSDMNGGSEVLFVPASDGYMMQWANAQRNSSVQHPVTGSGRLQWKVPFDSFGGGEIVTPVAMLAADGHIALQAQDHLMFVRAGGETGARIGINGLFPVVLGNKSFAYEDASDQLAYQTYDGKYLVEGHQVPLMKDRTHLVLLQPFGDGVISAVQYLGGVENPADPAKFYACEFKLGTAFWNWMVQDDGYFVSALLTHDDSLMAIVRNDRVEVYQTTDGEKAGEFETGFIRTLTASIDLEGRLVLVGQAEEEGADYSELKVIDLQGKSIWSLALLQKEFKQPPVCGSDGTIYLINMNTVQAVRDSNVVWQNSTPGGSPQWLTAVAGNEVVAVEPEGITVFAVDGSRRIEIAARDLEDQLDSPAAIDSQGRILVAGKKAIYCFQ